LRVNDIQLSPNFKLYEFESPDTRTVKLDFRLLELLQKLRDQWGKPVKINSGYRTPKHNERVGGTGGSLHLEGKAVDIDTAGLVESKALARLAQKVGFKGIGVYQGWVHVDVRDKIARWGEPF
jgi:uncharacterized protein YcbK (DUF882 family)